MGVRIWYTVMVSILLKISALEILFVEMQHNRMRHTHANYSIANLESQDVQQNLGRDSTRLHDDLVGNILDHG
jgi:hypothetical protein